MDNKAQTKAFNIVANYSTHIPDMADRSRLPEFLNTALKQTRHIFFGEAHVNGILLKTYEMLAQDPEIFKTAAQNGIRHLALEFSNQFQIHADRYANNEISRDQLQYALFENMFWRYRTQWLSGDAEKQFHRNFVQTIDNACSAGLKVHFADFSCEKAMTASQPELSRMEDDLKKKWKEEKSELPLAQYIFNHVSRLPQNEILRIHQLWQNFQKDWIKSRLDDTEQYEYLRSQMQPGDGILGVVGFSHLDMSGPNSITQHFQKANDPLTCIEIFDDRQTRAYFETSYRESGRVKGRNPDYTLFLNENAIYDQNLTVFSLAPLPAPITAPEPSNTPGIFSRILSSFRRNP